MKRAKGGTGRKGGKIAPAAMPGPPARQPRCGGVPSRGHVKPRRGISVSSRWGWGPSASEKKTRRMCDLASVLVVFGLSIVLTPTPTRAQSGEVTLKATSANVKEAGTPVRIQIVRWSTDEERNPVVAALNPVPPASAPARAAGDGGGAAAAGRGGAGRGGRGAAGRGGRGEAAVPLSPIAALTGAIAKGPTLGYIWTNDVTGYSIKYAYHVALPDGGERIILATDRRLGAYTAGWKPVPAKTLDARALAEAAPTDYEFTLLEIRLNSKGLGEGKTSLTTKVIVDNEAKTVALDNYAAAPAILQNVRR
jgi:hypothetical protein